VSEVWNKLLKQLGRAPRGGEAPESASPYRAVSVAPTRASCPAAVAIRDKRFLVAEAPTLPLPMCTWPLSCPCKLKMHNDRRARPQREPERAEAVKTQKVRRPTAGRRTTDR
jgi:hypothetical protein